MQNSLLMIREKAYKHNLTLDLKISDNLDELEITADKRKLKQIMFNLLSNSAKFTTDGGNITVEVKLDESWIVICVADTGIGVGVQYQEKIFHEFYQIRNDVMDKTPGTGLGLSLCRQFVRMHGGKIWVQSNGEGKGCQFIFTLPIGMDEDLWLIRTITREDILKQMKSIISLSRRHYRSFALCIFHTLNNSVVENALDIIDILDKEIRYHDVLGVDEEGNINLILHEIDRQKAQAVCVRFKKRLEDRLGNNKISFSLAIYPEDAESPEGLLKKVAT